jgi:peroxiredoxin
MTIKVGDRLPEGTLSEFIEVEGNGCSVGPNQFKDEDITKGKKVVIFGLPGAFTPTCSAKHVPSYVANFDKLKAKGVDAVYCMSVNDPFVMGAWGRDQKAGDKVHMMADGSADYTKKLGLELDLAGRGMGMRCQRFSMLVDDGVVKALNVEAPGKYEVSGAETMLTQLGGEKDRRARTHRAPGWRKACLASRGRAREALGTVRRPHDRAPGSRRRRNRGRRPHLGLGRRFGRCNGRARRTALVPRGVHAAVGAPGAIVRVRSR